MENVKLLESFWKSTLFIYLQYWLYCCKTFFIYSTYLHCPYCDINLFVANFIYPISLRCYYVVNITKLAIFVAKMSYIIVLVTTVYSLLELLVIIGLFDAMWHFFYLDISVFRGFVLI